MSAYFNHEQRTGTPETLQEAIVYFSDPRSAHVSPFRSAGRMALQLPALWLQRTLLHFDPPLWFCKGCKKQFTVKVGTIFED